jgi:hypothetical protein
MENEVLSHDDREAHKCELDQFIADITDKAARGELVNEDDLLEHLMDVEKVRGHAEEVKAARTMARRFAANAVPMFDADCDTTTILLAFGDDLPVGGCDFQLGIAGLAANSISTVAEANFVLDAIVSLDPKDALETMLASQIAATHHSAMTALGKMNRAETGEVMVVYETAANKLMRTFAAQTEALRKHRNKSTQTIRHVHVNQGGQAIVADTINHAGSGGGGDES